MRLFGQGWHERMLGLRPLKPCCRVVISFIIFSFMVICGSPSPGATDGLMMPGQQGCHV